MDGAASRPGAAAIPSPSTPGAPGDGGPEAPEARSSPCLIPGSDRRLFNEGRIHEQLGAHFLTVEGSPGVRFAVWAPGAERVSVVGDFNEWDGLRHPMGRLEPGGLWELFVPGVAAGALYKYEIQSAAGELLQKADPVAFAAEAPPRTASVVTAGHGFEWTDAEWMDRQRDRRWKGEPLSIYEVHPGSWRRGPGGELLGWRRLAHELAEYAAGLGFTHVELMAVAEHPFDGSWGYQVTGYFAPTARFGPPEDFAYFVDHLHGRGLGVILDWVPGQFPADAHGLARFDGTPLYENADAGLHPDWRTLTFDFRRPEVRSFLQSNALFWLDRFHVDGLRVDAVSSMLYLDYSRREGEWTPNCHGGRENLEAIEFLQETNRLVRCRHPGALTLAEESTAWPGVTRPARDGGLGFGFKWNMGWMNDVLRHMSRDPGDRRSHLADLTFAVDYAHAESFLLPLSHDEVVHGKGSLLEKMPGDDWQRFANLRLLLAWMFAFPGKKLLFMGGEFGQRPEWDHLRALEWPSLEHERHRGVRDLVRDLNGLYRSHPGLHRGDCDESGFEWIDAGGESAAIAFERRSGQGDAVVAACNFTAEPIHAYRLGLPRPGRWREVLNTDAVDYGGSGVGNCGAVESREEPCHGRRWSADLTLPPLAALVLLPPG